MISHKEKEFIEELGKLLKKFDVTLSVIIGSDGFLYYDKTNERANVDDFVIFFDE